MTHELHGTAYYVKEPDKGVSYSINSDTKTITIEKVIGFPSDTSRDRRRQRRFAVRFMRDHQATFLKNVFDQAFDNYAIVFSPELRPRPPVPYADTLPPDVAASVRRVQQRLNDIFTQTATAMNERSFDEEPHDDLPHFADYLEFPDVTPGFADFGTRHRLSPELGAALSSLLPLLPLSPSIFGRPGDTGGNGPVLVVLLPAERALSPREFDEAINDDPTDDDIRMDNALDDFWSGEIGGPSFFLPERGPLTLTDFGTRYRPPSPDFLRFLHDQFGLGEEFREDTGGQ